MKKIEPSEIRKGDRDQIAAILQLRHPGNMYSTCERDADAILAAGFSRATVPDDAVITEDQIVEVLYYSFFDHGQTYVLWPDAAGPRRETVYRQARAVLALLRGEVAKE